MPRHRRAEEAQVTVPPSDCIKKSKSVVDNSVGTNKPVAGNSDYDRLAQETVKLERTIPENETDLPTDVDVPIEQLSRNVQDDTSAKHMKNETKQENPIASVRTHILENTAGEQVGTTNNCINYNYVISLSEGVHFSATVSQKIKAKIWSYAFFGFKSGTVSPEGRTPQASIRMLLRISMFIRY